MNRNAAIWLILFLALFSTGCSSVVKAEQPAVLDSVVLNDANSVGQTFNAHFNGMDGVEVYLEPLEAGNGEIQLILRDGPQGQELGRASLSMREISAPGFYRFPLPVQAGSNQQSYYLLLRAQGACSFKAGAAPGNYYLDGALYQNGRPDDQRQMAFQLSYSAPRLALGLAGEILAWGWYLLIAGFLFILPGWAILDLTFVAHSDKMHWGLRLSLSAGISLAIYPIIILLTDFLGLHLGSLYAWGPPLLGLGLIIWQHRKQFNRKALLSLRIRPGWFDLTLIAIILIIFSARFWIIRMVAVPLWGDSLQHAMIAQLMLEHHGLFTSWQPYTPYYSLTTHFGFSAFSALFAWISGMDGTQATLWMGQIINGLAILTLYPLAVKISKGNRWAGIGALIVGGLISALPAVYVNWGRFAQLAGQAVLPVALWLLWESIDREKWSLRSEWPRLLLAGLALTGMVLSYYRMPFYYATFVVILLLFWGLPKWRVHLKNWGQALLRLSIIGLVGILFFLPWGLRLIGGNLAGAMEAGVTAGAPAARVLAEFDVFRTITDYIPVFSLGIAAIAILWGLVRKNWLAASLPLWFVLLSGYRLGASLKFPGANMLQAFAILIAVYLPAALLLGWLFGEIMRLAEKIPSRWVLAGASGLIILAAAWFGWQQRLLLDLPRYQLVTSADLRVMDWIEGNTPAEANFLVQSFVYGRTAAGSDAGWWLPLLAQRANMLPPQYAQFNETSQPSDYTQQVVDLVAGLQDHPVAEPESLAALCEWGITHIYHGQGQGQVGGPGALYQPAELLAQPDLFTRIYHQDRVSIFSLNPEACNQQP
jgi:hypothetical protein